MNQTMSVKEAAKRMGVSEQTVRVGLQQNVFPFGVAIKTSTKYTYIINRQKFEEEREIKRAKKEKKLLKPTSVRCR